MHALAVFASVQKNYPCGNVKDIKSGEALIGATIFVTKEKRGITQILMTLILFLAVRVPGIII